MNSFTGHPYFFKLILLSSITKTFSLSYLFKQLSLIRGISFSAYYHLVFSIVKKHAPTSDKNKKKQSYLNFYSPLRRRI